MNRSELVRQVAGRTGLGIAEADAAVKAVLAALEGALADGGTVRLAGLGTFGTKGRPARTPARGPGQAPRNPQTGAPVAVPASRAVAFRPAKALKNAVNGKRGAGSRP